MVDKKKLEEIRMNKRKREMEEVEFKKQIEIDALQDQLETIQKRLEEKELEIEQKDKELKKLKKSK